MGWIALLGAESVGAANPAIPEEELPAVGCTIVSGIGPVDPMLSLLALEETAAEDVPDTVGETSAVSGKRPVEAT